MARMIRILLEPQHYRHRGQYIARLEDGTEVVRNTRTPLYDSARELLRRGYPGDLLLTMRHAGSDMDAWVLTPLAELARWAIKEPNRGRIQRVKWAAYPTPEDAAPAYPVRARIDVEPAEAIPAPEDSLMRRPPDPGTGTVIS